MAKAVPTEQVAIDALAKLLADPSPRVLHGAKNLPGIFKGASAGEKAAAKLCLENRWLESTGEFIGKGRTRKELYRVTAAGVQDVLAKSDPSDLLRGLKDNLQQIGAAAAGIPRLVEEKVREILAPFASLPGTLHTLQGTIEQALARIKLPDLEELTRKLAQVPASSSPNQPTPPKDDWREEVVRLAVAQKQHNAFQRLTLPQVFERLRGRYPDVNLGQFHEGLRRLQDERRIRLGPYTQALATLDDPRNALYLDREVKYYVEPY